MRKFAEEYPGPEFVQQVVAQLPWEHNIFISQRPINAYCFNE